MAVTISIRDNIKDATRWLSDYERNQVPFAAALALTRTGKVVEKGLQQTMTDVFDNPTPFITRGTFATSAKKSDLTTTVGMRDQARNGRGSPADYVREQFYGGERGEKAFERAFRAIGALPAGWRAIPAAGIKSDRYGNPDRRAVAEVLGAMRRGLSVFSGRGKRAAQVGYFVVMPGTSDPRVLGLQPGVWRRTQRGGDRAVVPVFVFTQQAAYTPRIDLPALASQISAVEFPRQFAAALSRALRTAR